MKRVALAAVFIVVVSVFYSKNVRTAELQDVIVTATSKGLTEFTGAVEIAGLTDSAKAQKPPAPFVVFAPSNAAFTAANLGKNREVLRPVMKFHVVPGKKLTKEQLVPGQLESISGNKIEVLAGGQVKGANETATISESIECSNGIIHVIDKVLTPTKE